MIFSLFGSPAYGAGETRVSVSKKYNINWNEYNPNMYKDLKALEAKRDCYGLQYVFDLAVLNNKAHARQYGHNNVNLMRYIDQLLRRAKCYNS